MYISSITEIMITSSIIPNIERILLEGTTVFLMKGLIENLLRKKQGIELRNEK